MAGCNDPMSSPASSKPTAGIHAGLSVAAWNARAVHARLGSCRMGLRIKLMQALDWLTDQARSDCASCGIGGGAADQCEDAQARQLILLPNNVATRNRGRLTEVLRAAMDLARQLSMMPMQQQRRICSRAPAYTLKDHRLTSQYRVMHRPKKVLTPSHRSSSPLRSKIRKLRLV